MSFEIVTDSSANLPQSLIEEYNIHILSLSYFIEDEEFSSYIPGQENDLSYFYEKLYGKSHIRTSLVNAEQASRKMEELLREKKDILYIGFSSGLSGTFQAVSLACNDMKEKYPEAKIICVDTLSATLGQGLLVYYACMQRRSGKNMEEVAGWLEENKLKMCHGVMVEDLFFLKRGGRISAAAAVLGTALSLKPLIRVNEEGCLEVPGKTRGRKKAFDEMLRQLREKVVNPEEQFFGIAHADCAEDVQYIKEKMEELNPKGIIVEKMEPVIASHTGPGCVMIAYIGTKR